ncbi:chemotaxis protein CheA [uncultured Aureimonas sp.]|uniref:chemotaxis protein CheA n=1 Tax=uncultured Aureimonas sp. TaxID=1604662 RepID=UPI0025EED4F1|nr:chemotaxis protein CheA [uncultured Aureimonas sp.]
MDLLLQQFIPEARDLLESSTRALVALEADPSDHDAVNGLFRSVHTLKGTAGIFEIPAFTKLVHAAEDVLNLVREHKLVLEPELVDQLLAGMDLLSHWVEWLGSNGSLPSDAARVGAVHIATYRSRIAQDAAPVGAQPGAEPASVPAEVPPWVHGFEESDRLAAASVLARLGEEARLLAIEYRPDPQCFYAGEDPLYAIRQIPGLIAFQWTHRDDWEELRAADLFSCRVVLRVLADASRKTVDELFRYVTEQVSISDVAIEDLFHLDLASERDDASERELRGWLDLAADGDWLALSEAVGGACGRDGVVGSGARWLTAILEVPTPPAAAIQTIVRGLNGLEPRGPDDLRAKTSKTDGPMEIALADELSDVQARILALEPGSEDWRNRLPSVIETLARIVFATTGEDVREALTSAGDASLVGGDPAPLLSALATLMRPAGPAPKVPSVDGGSAEARGAKNQPKGEGEKFLKVEQSRVDAIMDLVGELVVAKNALPYLSRRAENEFGCRELAREIKHQYSALDRITQSMQGAIMQIRMMPVGSLFGRYPRLVRDISRKLGKEIELVIEGEDTEADKNVVEALSDPLLHIMRNSLDHGIEEPEDRIAAGKRRTALVRIRAFQEGDRVCIEVTDDGRGIDPVRITEKALAKGLIDAARASSMSPEEAVQLVFLAGFSTRDEASDLSGRGVGMDVVRTTVEQMGGDVSLSSTPGLGTKILLRLPLSMAVTRVMMVEVAGTLIGIPMETVAETVRLPSASIRRFKQAEMFLLRDALVPLVRMRSRLALKPDAEPRDSEAVLVCRLQGAPVGLVVDDFNVGIEVVLKPMSGLLAGLPGYAGTAVLGNGEVLLVLNLKDLL